MSLLRKVVKETLLAPVRVMQGAVDAAVAAFDAIDGKDPDPDRKQEERR